MDNFLKILGYVIRYAPVIITFIKELEDLLNEESQKTNETLKG